MRLTAVLKPPMAGEGSLRDETTGTADRRRSARRSLTLSATANPPSAGEFPVVIRDISPCGFLIEAQSTTLSPGDVITLDLPDNATVAANVAWASGAFFGCQLEQTISPAAVSAALLKGDPREPEPAGPSVPQSAAVPVASRGIWPDLNFSVPLFLSLFLWGVIGLAIYLIL